MSNENDWFNVGRNRINLNGGQYIPHVEGDYVQGQRIEGDYVKGQRINVDPSDSSQSSQGWGWVDDLKDAMRGMGEAFRQGGQQSQQEQSQQGYSSNGWTEYTDEYGNHTINTNGGNYCEHINGDVIQGSVINGRVVNGNYYNVGNTSWDESSASRSDSEWNTIDVDASSSSDDSDSGLGDWLGGLWK